MPSVKQIVLAAFCTIISSLHCLEGSAGVIVVNNDEWTISQTGFNNGGASTVRFVQNLISLFGGAGNYLAYTPPTTAQGGNTALTGDCCTGGYGAAGTSLRDTIEATGSTWTVTTAIPFDLDTLKQYKGILLTGPTVFSPAGCGASPAAPPCGYPDNQVLIDYVNSGGNIYLQGGVEWDAETERLAWGQLLNAFGLGFVGGPGLNGLEGLVNVGALGFNHPLFEGVTNLYFNNGNWVEIVPPNYHPELFAYGDNGLFAVSYVPEPSGLSLLALALLGLSLRARAKQKKQT